MKLNPVRTQSVQGSAAILLPLGLLLPSAEAAQPLSTELINPPVDRDSSQPESTSSSDSLESALAAARERALRSVPTQDTTTGPFSDVIDSVGPHSDFEELTEREKLAYRYKQVQGMSGQELIQLELDLIESIYETFRSRYESQSDAPFDKSMLNEGDLEYFEDLERIEGKLRGFSEEQIKQNKETLLAFIAVLSQERKNTWTKMFEISAVTAPEHEWVADTFEELPDRPDYMVTEYIAEVGTRERDKRTRNISLTALASVVALAASVLFLRSKSSHLQTQQDSEIQLEKIRKKYRKQANSPAVNSVLSRFSEKAKQSFVDLTTFDKNAAIGKAVTVEKFIGRTIVGVVGTVGFGSFGSAGIIAGGIAAIIIGGIPQLLREGITKPIAHLISNRGHRKAHEAKLSDRTNEAAYREARELIKELRSAMNLRKSEFSEIEPAIKAVGARLLEEES